MTPVTKATNLEDDTTHAPSTSANPPKDVRHDAAGIDDNIDTDKPSREEPQERTFTVRRWVPLPQVIADKKPEPKYLADRRPGLPPLYGHRAPNNTSTSGFTDYTPNISSTLATPSQRINPGDVVVGSVTVPADRPVNASGYRVSADDTTTPIGPGIEAGATTGVAGGFHTQPETPKRRPPPPPPKRKRKGGPGRSKKKVEMTRPVAEGPRSADAAIAREAGAREAGAVEGDNTKPTTTQLGGPDESKADTEMAEAAQESGSSDGGSSHGSSGSEDEGSEEGEIDEGGAPPSAAPDVSVQPPSPDLLGNLESEIQGMEGGAPAA
jgi:hypothetical protein